MSKYEYTDDHLLRSSACIGDPEANIEGAILSGFGIHDENIMNENLRVITDEINLQRDVCYYHDASEGKYYRLFYIEDIIARRPASYVHARRWGESAKLTDRGGHVYEDIGRSKGYIRYARVDQMGGGGIDSSSGDSEADSSGDSEAESEAPESTDIKKIKSKTYMTCFHERLRLYRLYDPNERDDDDRFELLRGKYIARQDIFEADADKDEGKVYGEINIYEIDGKPMVGYELPTYQAKLYGKLTELLDSDSDSESN